MKPKQHHSADPKAAFLKALGELYPIAHGTLSQVRKPCNSKYCKLCKSGEMHLAWHFTFRKGGKMRCMHVQPRHVETVRRAIENGRRAEEMILDEGIALMERLRGNE